MDRRIALVAATVLLLAPGCSGSSTESAAVSAPQPAATAPPAPSLAPAAAAPTDAAITRIDCGAEGGTFTSLAQAWGSEKRLVECNTLLNRKHRPTAQEQQAVKSFLDYAEDATPLTALDVMYGICASKDAEPQSYEDTHRSVLRATLMLCPDAPHARAMRAQL